ncbi:hypothetical protein [Thermocoleostomius sinensis]|jgi:CHASE1-domain containing sensor protein|uniref:Uncharacterized protein n=1 Tax=Thermocoleostomius sinensis A174 TaxID=2016057 RepID=A0A9E9C9C6_9CYAN|nr:hypothetical protein [Thermocoleostomius sinensis]WAL62509.1 hypothetical protein OXH18_11100 [Thermocoleostomius sinensis A174]
MKRLFFIVLSLITVSATATSSALALGQSFEDARDQVINRLDNRFDSARDQVVNRLDDRFDSARDQVINRLDNRFEEAVDRNRNL